MSGAMVKLKKYTEAEAEIQIVPGADQNNAAAWNALGVVLLATDRKSRAVEAFENALKLRPDYEDAKNNLREASVN